MIVRIDSILFEKSSVFSEVDRIFDMFISGRYDGHIDNYNIDRTGWYIGAREPKQQFVKELIAKSVNQKSQVTISENNDLSSKVYSLSDGLIFLESKILVFLENSYNDERFIRALLTKFNIGKKALKFLQNNWLEVRNGAGSALITQIYSELRKYRRNSLSNHEYLKAIVIIDSDKKHPGHVVDKSKYVDVCAIQGIDLHILEKREMENYLPLPIMNLDDKIDAKIMSAISNLSPKQLDHYDFELGFDVDSQKKMNGVYSNFYEDVSPSDFTILKLGFRNSDFKTKNRIPALFLKHELTYEMLKKRCVHQNNPNELEDIIGMINRLL